MSQRLRNTPGFAANLPPAGAVARARAAKPARKPPARLLTPPQSERIGGKGLSGDLLRKIGGLNKLFPKLNVQQKKAFRDLHQLLEPSKFGGQDRTLNHGDVAAIKKSLLSDKVGLQRLATKRLQGKGKNIQAKLVEDAFSSQSGIIGSVVRNRVEKRATALIESRLNKVLNDENVDPNTEAYFDDVPRKVSFRDAAKFQRAHKVFRDLRQQTEQSLGVRLVFPKGLSQDFMKHVVEGRPGFPPDVSFRER